MTYYLLKRIAAEAPLVKVAGADDDLDARLPVARDLEGSVHIQRMIHEGVKKSFAP